MALDKLVDSTLLDASCTYEAGKIREKLGSSAQIAYDLANGKGFGDAIAAIPSGGGGISVDDIAMRLISGAITLSEATEVKASAFINCSQITSVSSDTVKTLRGNCFRSCSGLTSVNFPGVTTLADDRLFQDCTALLSIFLPKMTSAIMNYTFSGCTHLETAVFPLGGAVNTQGFVGCSALEKVDLGGATGSIASEAFKNSKLKILVLRATAARTLSNINAFSGTPFASGGTGGTLYVPNSILSTYQSASNWSTILGYTNNQIKSIESTHTDPNAPIDLTLYYADGTLIPT